MKLFFRCVFFMFYPTTKYSPWHNKCHSFIIVIKIHNTECYEKLELWSSSAPTHLNEDDITSHTRGQATKKKHSVIYFQNSSSLVTLSLPFRIVHHRQSTSPKAQFTPRYNYKLRIFFLRTASQEPLSKVIKRIQLIRLSLNRQVGHLCECDRGGLPASSCRRGR